MRALVLTTLSACCLASCSALPLAYTPLRGSCAWFDSAERRENQADCREVTVEAQVRRYPGWKMGRMVP